MTLGCHQKLIVTVVRRSRIQEVQSQLSPPQVVSMNYGGEYLSRLVLATAIMKKDMSRSCLFHPAVENNNSCPQCIV